MDSLNENVDLETLESAYLEINYYSNLPKHIKGSAQDLRGKAPLNNESNTKVAHVVDRSITIARGKVNIPSLVPHKKFLNQNIDTEEPCPHPTFN